jgi:hypothetical protein
MYEIKRKNTEMKKIITIKPKLPFGKLATQIITRINVKAKKESCSLACFKSLGSLGLIAHRKIKVPSEKGVRMFRISMSMARFYY